MIVTRSLPNPENVCQRSVNDALASILGNLMGNRLQMVVNKFLAAFRVKTDSDTLSASLGK